MVNRSRAHVRRMPRSALSIFRRPHSSDRAASWEFDEWMQAEKAEDSSVLVFGHGTNSSRSRWKSEIMVLESTAGTAPP